jgi:Rps23 Pro-64 3,4-dihydroxylase Tpa1-like proline 4-hydroxylase
MTLLNPSLKISQLAQDWQQDNRLRITNALQPDMAVTLAQTLQQMIEYNVIMAPGGEFKKISQGELMQMSQEDRSALLRGVLKDATNGHGYLYHGHHLDQTTNDTLKTFLDQLNAPETINTIRQITGMDDIMYADAQATEYRPGHYLTRHLDQFEGEQRRVAFVFSLTPTWHPDWGGLLQFYEQDGTPRDAWSPGMNLLALFDVKHIHAVTYVAPFAAGPRYSITGWFKA